MKETIEEAAERNSIGIREENYKDGFIDGAKWQQERMYSEEEVEEKTLLAMISIMQEYSIINESSVVQFHKEWFEQFKKK